MLGMKEKEKEEEDLGKGRMENRERKSSCPGFSSSLRGAEQCSQSKR